MYIHIKYDKYIICTMNFKNSGPVLLATGRIDFSNDILNLFDGHVHFLVRDVLMRHNPHSCIVYLRYPNSSRSYFIIWHTVTSVNVHLFKGCKLIDKLFLHRVLEIFCAVKTIFVGKPLLFVIIYRECINIEKYKLMNYTDSIQCNNIR